MLKSYFQTHVKFEDNNPCPICYDEKSCFIIELLCSHRFHASCLESWRIHDRLTSVSCPYCRYTSRYSIENKFLCTLIKCCLEYEKHFPVSIEQMTFICYSKRCLLSSIQKVVDELLRQQKRRSLRSDSEKKQQLIKKLKEDIQTVLSYVESEHFIKCVDEHSDVVFEATQTEFVKQIICVNVNTTKAQNTWFKENYDLFRLETKDHFITISKKVINEYIESKKKLFTEFILLNEKKDVL